MPYPQAGKFIVANESKKHAANLPNPPLPKPGSFSSSKIFSAFIPIYINDFFTVSSMSILISEFYNILPNRYSIDK